MKRLILPVLVLSLLGITAAGAYPTPRTEQATSNELLVEVGHKGVKATHGQARSQAWPRLQAWRKVPLREPLLDPSLPLSSHRLAALWLRRGRALLVLPVILVPRRAANPCAHQINDAGGSGCFRRRYFVRPVL